MVSKKHIFVWRGEATAVYASENGDNRRPEYESSAFLKLKEIGLTVKCDFKCPFCNSTYKRIHKGLNEPNRKTRINLDTCERCGFWWSEEEWHNGDELRFAILTKFEMNNADLAFSELGTHLKRRITDIYNLTPRRFEELVADIFKCMGFYVHLTKKTRDGGYDMILLESSSGHQTIVECKRYSPEKKISISLVRQLLGVQFYNKIKRAKLITTSLFSKPATDFSKKLTSIHSDYTLELIDIEDITKALNVYNENIPPLEALFANSSYNDVFAEQSIQD